MAAPSEAPDKPEVLRLLEKWHKPSLHHDSAELRTLERVTESGKEFWRRRFERSIAEADGRPLLLSYAGDGTKLRTVHGSSVRYNCKRARLCGRQFLEYYVQLCFLEFVDPSGRKNVTVMFDEPNPMTDGQGAAASAAFALRMIMNPRKYGHGGLIIFHCAFDRALLASVSRILKQWWKKEAVQQTDIYEHPPDILYLMQWFVETGCSMHDTHKSIEWSLWTWYHNKSLMKNVHLAIESLRDSMQQLSGLTPEWMWDVTVARSAEELDDPDDLKHFWLAMGVEESVVATLVSLRLRYFGGRLEILDTGDAGEDTFTNINFCLFSVWRLKKFNGSRWHAATRACQMGVGAIFGGLRGLAKHVLDRPNAQDFYLGGVERLGSDELHFMVTAATASFPAGAVMQMLLRDSRVAKHLCALKTTIREAMDKLCNYGDGIWGLFGRVCNMAGPEVRHSSIGAAHVAIGFMMFRFVWKAEGAPWCMVRGDVDANLDALKRGPIPTEPITEQMWHLDKFPWGRRVNRQGVALLADIPWDTIAAEHLHASGALRGKFRPDTTCEGLMARAFIHMSKKVPPGLDEDERREAMLHNRLKRLEKRRPQSYQGREQYVKELVELSKARNLQAFNRERLKKAAEKPPLRFSSCKLAQGDFLEWDEIFNSGAFRDGRGLDDMRKAAREAPPKLTKTFLDELEGYAAEEEGKHDRPPWFPAVVRNRESFASTIWGLQTGGECKYYKFIFAAQSPQFIMFAPLGEKDAYFPAHVSMFGGSWEDACVSQWLHNFTFGALDFAAWFDLPLPDDAASIRVLRNAHYAGGYDIACDDVGGPLSALLASLPRAPVAENRSGGASSTRAWKDEFLKHWPWLAGKFEEEESERRRAAGRRSGLRKGESDDETPEEQRMNDEDIEEMMEHLHAVREEWDLGPDAPQDFLLKVLGGKWCMEHYGVPFDAFKGEAHGEMAIDFAERYLRGATARFNISFYTIPGAHLCAETWCCKAQHFFDRRLASGARDYVFTEQDVMEYTETPKFLQLVEAATDPRAKK
ncbi:unnamed protein product, partial [Prorocentrum cordatum]